MRHASFIPTVLCLTLLSLAAGAQERVVKPKLLTPERPFSEGATVSENETRFLGEIEVNTIETGEKDGVLYRVYYTDGSGTFAGSSDSKLDYSERDNWSVACRKDVMDDSRYCYMHRGDLWVFAYSDGKRRVSIGGDTYPGTPTTLRVDANAPLNSPNDTEGTFGPSNSEKAIAQMRAGAKVATRYIDWPYRTNVDSVTSLYGFKEAYAYLEWALANSR